MVNDIVTWENKQSAISYQLKGMKKQLNKLIQELKSKKHVDKKNIDEFIKRIENGTGFTRDENPESHFCSFFLPVNLQSKSVFLIDHRKGKDWMPPGGHIDLGETPRKTVFREFWEELDHQLKNERVELFDISVTKIKGSKVPCRAHYDFWYLVFVDKVDFKWLKDEFYSAGWFEVNEGVSKIKKNPHYQKVLKKVSKILMN